MDDRLQSALEEYQIEEDTADGSCSDDFVCKCLTAGGIYERIL